MAIHPDPAQRTASTARALVLAGLACAAEAVWRGSAARTLMAAVLVACGAGLLLAAKRAA